MAPVRRQRHNRSSCCASFLVGISSAPVALLGIAIVVVSALVYKDKLSDDYFPKCDDCNKIFYVLWAFGAILIVAGIMGIAAAVFRSRALAIPFMILIGISILAFIAILVLVIVFAEKPNALHLDKAWSTTVSDDPKAACQIQKHLQCSGYSSCCGSSDDSADLSFMTVASPSTRLMAPVKPAASATTTHRSNITKDEEPQDLLLLAVKSSCSSSSSDCPSDCSSNSNITPCETAIIHFVRKYFWAIVGVDVAIIVLSLLLLLRVRRLSKGNQDDEGFAGEQQNEMLNEEAQYYPAPQQQYNYGPLPPQYGYGPPRGPYRY